MSSHSSSPSPASCLDQLTGRRIPGGCDDCHAYQRVTKQEGIYLLTVHHDDTCPSYREMT